MNKLLLSIMSLAITAVLASPAMAAIKDPKINKHQHHQQKRIAQGVKSGELTRGESKDLVSDQRDIRKEERQYKADGQFTKNERQEVRQDQHAASKEIYQEKHDAQDRPRAN